MRRLRHKHTGVQILVANGKAASMTALGYVTIPDEQQLTTTEQPKPTPNRDGPTSIAAALAQGTGIR